MIHKCKNCQKPIDRFFIGCNCGIYACSDKCAIVLDIKFSWNTEFWTCKLCRDKEENK
jgi:hypothetical protein